MACYRCGGKNHSQAYCYHRHAVCHNCGKKGHIGRVCHSKVKPQQHRDNPQPQQRGKKSTNRNYRLEDERPSASADISDLEYIEKTKPITVIVLLNSVEVEMEVDTGASFSIISERIEVYPTVPH